jgi:ribosomal protein S18 acetylase RimI-like enzyme/predicted kinase
VIVVTGISAAGKSTVADVLARRFERGVHVRGDVFRRMVVSGRRDMAPGAAEEASAQLLLRHSLAATVADGYAEAGFTTVLQDILFARLGDVVAALRARPRYVVVLCPRPEVVAAREAARTKTAYRPGGYTVEELHRALVEETPRIGLWLDNSEQAPEESVEAILAQAGRARVDEVAGRSPAPTPGAPLASANLVLRPFAAGDTAWAEELIGAFGGRLQARRGELVDALGCPGIVAEGAHGRAGLLTYRLGEDDAEIVYLATATEHAGVGTLLLDAFEERAGPRRVWLVTTNDNLDALRFYQRRRFVISAVRPGAVDDARATLKPAIPAVGSYGMPIRDEIELTLERPGHPRR